MKTGILITARLGSTRLKRKHLLIVNGRPIIYYLIERIKKAFNEEIRGGDLVLIIATSDEPDNREFENLVKTGITVFYGSINNIPLRHLQAAKAYALDSVIAIDGDDILCSVNGMRAVYCALMQGAKYVKTSNLPFGMNSFGYTKYFLESSLKGHFKDILETGWGSIFDQSQLVDVNIPFSIHYNELRFTLDYKEDYLFLKSVIEDFGDRIFTAHDEEIVKFVIDKELYRITEPIAKKYWENFHRIQGKERQISNITD